MTPDLQRALAEIDRMIEEADLAHFRAESITAGTIERLRAEFLRKARSRLSALATTTHGEQSNTVSLPTASLRTVQTAIADMLAQFAYARPDGPFTEPVDPAKVQALRAAQVLLGDVP